jgi:hypothetical protein
VVGEHAGQRSLQLVGRRCFVEVGHPLDTLPEEHDIPSCEREEDVDDRLLLERIETAHGPEVDEPE